jgi:hypothetical protein
MNAERNDGGPLTDITALRRVVFVLKGGRVRKNVAPRTRLVSLNDRAAAYSVEAGEA